MNRRPRIRPIVVPPFPVPEEIALHQGVMAYGFEGAMTNILRIDFVLEGGRWTEPKPMLADTATRLMKSGTSRFNAYELENRIDHHGATIKVNAGYHGLTISLFTMRRHLPKVLDILRECWEGCIYPESELEIHRKNALARLRTNEQKAEFLAEMAFKELIFGKRHPYGYATTADFIRSINRDDLVQYHQSQLRGIKPTIYIGGRYREREIGLLDDFILSLNLHDRAFDVQHAIEEGKGKVTEIHKKGLSQVSVMMGKRLFNRKHPDYAAFILMNTIFGGYFGSRLMLNIREDKGYTYGIYSGLQTYRNAGVFYIQTDTGKENLQDCVSEIRKECDRMQQEPVTQDELSQARNYLLGKFLTRMDGPFAQLDLCKSYHTENIALGAFNEFADIILDVKPATLQHLAEQYLDFESFIQVIAGS